MNLDFEGQKLWQYLLTILGISLISINR